MSSVKIISASVMDNDKRMNRWYFGGISSATAVSVTHPLDLIKVHLQTQQLPKKSLLETIGHIYEAAGFLGFYNGISASLLRQLTYTTTRFGIYESGKQHVDMSSFTQALCLAAFAGFCGGIVGVPADMINVRMQNDLKLPEDKRRNYKHVFDGISSVFKSEGFRSLFQGGSAAVLRGALMTVGQNAFYDRFKSFLLTTPYFKDNSITYFVSSFLSGGMATLMTQPLDVMKTRLMNAKPGQYTGLLSVAFEIGKVGPMGFFKGFIPAFMRIGPHTILTFLLMEQLRLHFGYFPKVKAIAM